MVQPQPKPLFGPAGGTGDGDAIGQGLAEQPLRRQQITAYRIASPRRIEALE